jgi:hypothetical protein
MTHAGRPDVSSTSAVSLSGAEARRLAIAAQGLSGDPPALGTPIEVLRHLSAVQLDAIQRVDKAHRLVCLARVAQLRGRQSIDRELWSPDGHARVFESWAHALCLLPIDDWPLWDFARRRRAGVSWAPPPAVCERLISQVTADGPLTLRQLETGPSRSSGWNWSGTRTAAEYLLWTGQLICAERRGAQRVYDLPERRVPPQLLDREVGAAEAVATLVRRAAGACGVATLRDVAEYLRLSPATVASAWPPPDLLPATVEGWAEPAWVVPEVFDLAVEPAGPVFLAPFDNLVWDRERTRRLFGFDFVFEAYKPVAKRRYGYYVTPLLVGDALVGRVDLARDNGTLRALSVHAEPGAGADLDAVRHAGRRLAGQLGCQEFTVDAARRPPA